MTTITMVRQRTHVLTIRRLGGDWSKDHAHSALGRHMWDRSMAMHSHQPGIVRSPPSGEPGMSALRACMPGVTITLESCSLLQGPAGVCQGVVTRLQGGVGGRWEVIEAHRGEGHCGEVMGRWCPVRWVVFSCTWAPEGIEGIRQLFWAGGWGRGEQTRHRSGRARG